MIVRLAVVSFVAMSSAGCANQGPMQPMALGFHSQLDAARPVVTHQAPAGPVLQGTMMKQTLGGKVLSAIALERATGRRPDPRRFKELR